METGGSRQKTMEMLGRCLCLQGNDRVIIMMIDDDSDGNDAA